MREAQRCARSSSARAPKPRTELFIETPYRNVAMLGALADTLNATTRVCVAADLTLDTETIECRNAPATGARAATHARFDRSGPADLRSLAAPTTARSASASP